MARTKIVSILGCGWLGLPLGAYLNRKGLRIKGSTTRKEKSFFLYQSGVEPFILKLNPGLSGRYYEDFFNCDVMIVNFPPKIDAKKGSNYLDQIKAVIEQIKDSRFEHVIFTSSTSVYGNQNKALTEGTKAKPESERAKLLFEAEKLFLAEKKWLNTTILRLGGLVGPERHPGNFYTAKDGKLPGAHTPTNLVHRDDVIDVIHKVIEQEKWNEVYNIVADEHPTKRNFYTFAALSLEISPAIFKADDSLPKRIVSNSKAKKELNLELQYPDLSPVFIED